jgi:heme exporter protein D
VLLLAARLLAERRAAEQTLMASRGASGRQIFALAALEALAVAVVTTAIAPWLAALLYRAITGIGTFERAGLHRDPGHPLNLWVACAAAALVLAAVLLGPVLRRRGSVADAEQQLVRQDRRGGLARTGADLALVVIAGLALFQLRSYHSPVVHGVGNFSSVDPVLVAAPALVLLAGAVVALRLVPLVAHIGERLAARSRSLVGPLAAWEVGRRPGRAAGAVLLLTLVVGVGAFAQSFLATWRASQVDQTDLATGTDVRVLPLTETPLEASAAIAGEPAVRSASPVTDRQVSVGVQTDITQATLMAVDTTHADDLLRGRTARGSWAAETRWIQPDDVLAGPALHGTPTDVIVDVSASTTPSLFSSTLLVWLILEDAHGALTPVELPAIAAQGSHHDLVVPLPVAARGSSIVGFKTSLLPSLADRDVLSNAAGDLNLRVSVSNLRVVQAPADKAAAKKSGAVTEMDPADVAPVKLGGGHWTVTGISVQGSAPSLVFVDPSDTALSVHADINPTLATLGGQGFTVVGTKTATTVKSRWGGVPVLVTPGFLSSVGGEVGDTLTVALDGSFVTVAVVGTIDHLPGEPAADGMLADSAALNRVYLLASGISSLADQWWLGVPDASADAVAHHLTATDVGDATSRVAARQDATVGPLHIGIQAALWIVTIAAVGLAVAGLALSATVSVRTRRLELARLQAVGASRGSLVASVLAEYAVLGALGVAVGLGLGALLGHQIAPLITVSNTGAPPVPPVLVHWPWGTQAELLVLLVALVALTVTTTANALLRRASGELLRLGDER